MIIDGTMPTVTALVDVQTKPEHHVQVPVPLAASTSTTGPGRSKYSYLAPTQSYFSRFWRAELEYHDYLTYSKVLESNFE